MKLSAKLPGFLYGRFYILLFNDSSGLFIISVFCMRDICDNSSSVITLFNEGNPCFEFREHGTWCELVLIHVFLRFIYGDGVKIFLIVLTKV